MNDQVPWQLKMFRKTLKKKLRLGTLKKHLGQISKSDRCLLVTCGDNNGAMNYHLRNIGGEWSWADLEDKSIEEMKELLGDDVYMTQANALPFPDDTFACVVSVDVHEHLVDPLPFTRELRRVAKPGGRIIISVPNGNEKKLATRIKNAIGMTKEKYGHVKEGYDIPELEELMEKSNIKPTAASSFSRFFTEMLELSINFLYVNVLSKKGDVAVTRGTIAPPTKKHLQSVKKVYRIYSLIYPFFWVISKLDCLCCFGTGYVVLVEGERRA